MWNTDKRYRLSIDVDATTLTDAVLEVIGYNNGNMVTIPLSAGYKHYQVDFLANISITLKVRLVSGSGTRTVYVDNVKLEELKGRMGCVSFRV